MRSPRLDNHPGSTRSFSVVHGALLGAGIAMLASGVLAAQSAAPKPAARPPARAAATPQATLNQVMQGILFPNSNVIFASQHDEFAQRKPDADGSLSTDPIVSLYGGWTAVENSSLALVEASRLIGTPGRKCSNGKPVPLTDPAFAKFVADLRTSGQAAYAAAQTKDQDRMLDAADKVATACSHCHTAYREKSPAQGGAAARCTS